MDTMNLNAELFRELSYIADDESSMKKLLEYVKKLAAQQYGRREEAGETSLSSAVVAEDAEEYRPLTKAELIADVDEMCEEIKLIRAGKLKGKSWEEFKHELHN
ncbi:cytochrome P450 [Bacteroides sp. ET71]|uniref:cytochrome P450 n=1 Tax=Bacteroides sp. ET71 TaxID=2939421 RepID=UPI00201358B0|nr:cytochrome P450 [Bacteroides sp. ET71]MCL1616550.1 cytochrome P450 [Bacteroides sp. ET71]